MSISENTPDDLENEGLTAKDEEAVEDVDLSNIDDDFDDDDEFYAGANDAKGKWLNIIGIACFVIAGLVGVWQFWLSGVDKYEQKPPVVKSAETAPIVEPALVVEEENIISDIAEDDIVVNEQEVDELIDELEADISDILPDVSVEMSEEEISDAELATDTLSDEQVENSEDIDEIMASLDEKMEVVEPVEGQESLVEQEQNSVDPVLAMQDTPAPEEIMPAEEEMVTDEMVEEETPQPMPETASAPLNAQESSLPEAEDVALMEEENVTPEIIEEVAQEKTLPAPAPQELEDLVTEEVAPVQTVVPDQIEYGSLTPEQILERAVVVRPKPKKLVVVKKDRSSTSSRSILVAADRSLKQGNFADALSLYDDVLSTSPKDSAALMGKALTLQKLNHEEEAIQAYKTVLDKDPNNLNALTNYLGLIKEEGPLSSINQLQEMESKNPDSAAIAGTLGMLYGEMKDVSNAAKYFNKAQALDPNNAVYPYNLAILSDRMGSKAKALEHYQKTLQLVLRYGGQGVVSEQVVARRIKELNAIQ